MKGIRFLLLGRMLLFFAVVGTFLNLSVWGLFLLFRDRIDGTLPRTIQSAYSKEASTDPDAILTQEMTNRLRYAQELMNGLKDHSSAEAFRREADSGLDARFESPSLSWSTRDGLPPLEKVLTEARPMWPFHAFRVSSSVVARQDGEVRWAVFFPPEWRTGIVHDPRMRMGLIINVLITLVLCWLFSRWQLFPLRDLSRGAKEIGEGNLDHHIPIRQNSELGDLANSFNQMSARLRTLIRSKEDMLIAVSHELRSPLMRIRLALEVEKENAIPRIRRHLGEIEELTNDILESSFLESAHAVLDQDDIILRDLLEEVRQTMELAPESLETSEQARLLPSFPGDRRKLKRLFINLIENGQKYSSRKPVYIDARILHESVEIEVTDQGGGVPPEVLDRIFEPFFRVDPSRNRKTGGFGFGLYLCRRIAESHGGTLVATNQSGGGLKLKLTLPRQRHNPIPKPS